MTGGCKGKRSYMLEEESPATPRSAEPRTPVFDMTVGLCNRGLNPRVHVGKEARNL